MAAIRETLTLEDKFSATFTRFLSLGNKAANAADLASNANRNYQSVLNTLDRQLISTNAKFEALTQEQNALVAAGKQNTEAFDSLENRINSVGQTIRELTAQYNVVA